MPRPKKNKQAGAAFKELLEQKGFSNYKLAKAIGMDTGHIGRIASGEVASPTPATLEKIAAALGVELGELTMIFAQSLGRSHSAAVPQRQEQAQEETPSKNTDFVGREEAIAHLDNLVNEGAKVILIQGEGGIGKTTLAEKWFERQGLKNPLELDVGTTRQTIYPAEDWVKQTLRSYFDENPEQNFRAMLEQLKHKLQTKRIGVLIHNLEVALFNGEFIKPNENYIELLRVLAHSTVQSVTLITSRELLHEPGVMSLQTVKKYPKLEGLDLEAWGKYFDSNKISVDVDALSDMQQAYGGNAEAMDMLRGDVQEQFQGNLKAYWQKNRDDLLRHPTLEKLVQRQFNKLRDDNSQAHELLCRFGFYPNRNFPAVPKVWLFCLLWDVPEKRRQRVIDDLCDRSLVKVSDDGYYLHPVIRAEAVERLKLIDKSNIDTLFLIKKQIDFIVLTKPDKIQKFLLYLNQKINLPPEIYKQSAFRSFYLGMYLHLVLENRHETINHSINKEFIYCGIASNIDRRFELLDLSFIMKFLDEIGDMLYERVIPKIKKNSVQKFYKSSKKHPDKEAINTLHNEVLERVLEEENNKISKMIDNLVQSYKDNSNFIYEVYIQGMRIFDSNRFDEIKKYSSDELKPFLIEILSNLLKKCVETLKDVLLDKHEKSNLEIAQKSGLINDKFRLSWKFNDEENKLLKQYYDVNLLLVYCLANASEEIRSKIEDTILLPSAEIEKRRLGD